MYMTYVLMNITQYIHTTVHNSMLIIHRSLSIYKIQGSVFVMGTFLKVTEGGLSEIALYSMNNRVYFILTRQPLLYWRR